MLSFKSSIIQVCGLRFALPCLLNPPPTASDFLFCPGSFPPESVFVAGGVEKQEGARGYDQVHQHRAVAPGHRTRGIGAQRLGRGREQIATTHGEEGKAEIGQGLSKPDARQNVGTENKPHRVMRGKDQIWRGAVPKPVFRFLYFAVSKPCGIVCRVRSLGTIASRP